MLLYDIFLEIDARHLSSSYQDTLLTRTELEFALIKINIMLSGTPNADKTKAYRHFLEFCKQQMAILCRKAGNAPFIWLLTR